MATTSLAVCSYIMMAQFLGNHACGINNHLDGFVPSRVHQPSMAESGVMSNKSDSSGVKNMMKRGIDLIALHIASMILLLVWTGQILAQDSSQRLSTVRNSASQRYEINQTFDGQVYRKDNNVWAYTKEFADLFGMPEKYIDDVRGIAAAAFRIEDTSFQECGFGGRADACRKVEQCVLDLYFDESKHPLPWATEIRSQWSPGYSSMIWLRPLDPRERPHGALALDPPPGIIRNSGLHSEFIPFADPVTKVEAIFTTNARTDRGGDEAVSGRLPLLGYMRDFYRGLSVASLQFGCGTLGRRDINIRLDAVRRGPYETPVARFNRVYLPPAFVQRVNERMKAQSDSNAVFYRSLFPPPLGTKATPNNDQGNQ